MSDNWSSVIDSHGNLVFSGPGAASDFSASPGTRLFGTVSPGPKLSKGQAVCELYTSADVLVASSKKQLKDFSSAANMIELTPVIDGTVDEGATTFVNNSSTSTCIKYNVKTRDATNSPEFYVKFNFSGNMSQLQASFGFDPAEFNGTRWQVSIDGSGNFESAVAVLGDCWFQDIA